MTTAGENIILSEKTIYAPDNTGVVIPGQYNMVIKHIVPAFATQPFIAQVDLYGPSHSAAACCFTSENILEIVDALLAVVSKDRDMRAAL